jgi:hypothetical protein
LSEDIIKNLQQDVDVLQALEAQEKESQPLGHPGGVEFK